MAIVTSAVVEDSPQRDGRRRITERFQDHLGIEYLRSYLADIGFDPAAFLNASAAQIEAQSVENEILSNIARISLTGSDASPTLVYSTAAQNFLALRVVYSTANRVQAIMIGDFLSARTDAQLRTAFNRTQAQIITLRDNKLTPAANMAAQIRATSGE